ncbi:hypothetical protein GCM10010112_12750 [Actinoplanes lobatus]|uniref:Uncharacterized protein n=1 Tax=Actinoplanes lobatus TaxID=113568 RepID=A0A7W7HM69_9ACTN|nr:hypothetical protein [Actinoplanes lobatus]MBB4753113.1 hypothetical protein [Actinoplanes lobatus]GGN58735.1 hypothetical protein GCM10010112_12750 [Actinoplanes lobatus]GIE43027.1 hypothetical protein Alo02nite_59250 [Actinoplanes lobatus]
MTMTTGTRSGCCGGCADTPVGATGRGGVLERPRYFPRQLITPDDLTAEADYFRERLRRHNRFLHGWGVVSGALVCVIPEDPAKPEAGNRKWTVRVQPGYLLTPPGDEVWIGTAQDVTLRGGVVSAADGTTDPWCVEVFDDDPEGPLHVAVRYEQFQVRPVLAQPGGCGCGSQQCEYSRYQDGFVLGVLSGCDDVEDPAGRAGNPPYDPAAPGPWVVLAEVTLAPDGTVEKIDNCVCRRILEPGTWRRCDGTDQDWPPEEKAEEKPKAAAPPRRRRAPTT